MTPEDKCLSGRRFGRGTGRGAGCPQLCCLPSAELVPVSTQSREWSDTDPGVGWLGFYKRRPCEVAGGVKLTRRWSWASCKDLSIRLHAGVQLPVTSLAARRRGRPANRRGKGQGHSSWRSLSSPPIQACLSRDRSHYTLAMTVARCLSRRKLRDKPALGVAEGTAMRSISVADPRRACL